MSRRRPSEVITSLRAKAEEAKQYHPSTTASSKSINSIIKVNQDARFCPSGHCFSRVLLTQRRRHVQEEQGLPFSIIPPISCSACSAEISNEYIAACCKSCGLDFCDECFQSGMPIEELMQDQQNARDDDLELDPTVSMSMSEMTMITTDASCSLGHPLRRVLTTRRKRYIHERDRLDSSPSIECDCCSRVITSDFIAGCCVQCDIDFCENCFQSGLSFEEVLQEPVLVVEENVIPIEIDGRYNGRRPTYKRSGRVSYDDYPDPSAFQWQFTGSCEMSCVEYFEKDFGYQIGVVKLDFFYAKGKVRTVLEHPRKGTRPLFTKDNKISSNLYRKILLDPRQYAQKSAKKQVL